MKSESLWDASGENTFGFNGLPYGFGFHHGDFSTKWGKYCNFWSSDSKEDTQWIGFSLTKQNDYIDIPDITIRFQKGMGRSIRLN